MCTIIVTIRSVLWAVMTIAGTLMILVSLFTNRWLIGSQQIQAFGDFPGPNNFDYDRKAVGLFLDCLKPEGNPIFEGECIPKLDLLMEQMNHTTSDDKFPHAWKGAVGCFGLGLGIMIVTVVLALLTPCCRYCFCCSTFMFCGSVQMFAAVLFSIGLLAYPAGWSSRRIRDLCGEEADAFVLGNCQFGGAYWMAVAGTIATLLASSLTVFAYKSTKGSKTRFRRQDGDKFICVP